MPSLKVKFGILAAGLMLSGCMQATTFEATNTTNFKPRDKELLAKVSYVKTPVAEPVRAVPDAEPLATITFTCPGCQQELQLRAAPWVMTEVNRDPGRYYVWDCEPGVAGPAHICGRT